MHVKIIKIKILLIGLREKRIKRIFLSIEKKMENMMLLFHLVEAKIVQLLHTSLNINTI